MDVDLQFLYYVGQGAPAGVQSATSWRCCYPSYRVLSVSGGIAIDSQLGNSADVSWRVALAYGAFGQVRRLWKSSLSRKTKAGIFVSCVASTLLWGSEHWTLQAPYVRRLNGTYMTFVIDPFWESLGSHADLLQLLGVPSLLTLLQRRLASWLGHLVRMDSSRFPRQFLFGMLTGRRFPSSTETKRRHSDTSRVQALKILQQLPGIDHRICFQQARDRTLRATAVKKILQLPPKLAPRSAPIGVFCNLSAGELLLRQRLWTFAVLLLDAIL